MTSSTFHEAFLGPTDLALVKRILVALCADRAIEIESREGDELAASLIRQFQRGLRDEEQLMTLFGVSAVGRSSRIKAVPSENAPLTLR